jgi:hypothetical protein
VPGQSTSQLRLPALPERTRVRRFEPVGRRRAVARLPSLFATHGQCTKRLSRDAPGAPTWQE